MKLLLAGIACVASTELLAAETRNSVQLRAPHAFERNLGQAPEGIRFLGRAGQQQVLFEDDGVAFLVSQFLNAAPHPNARPELVAQARVTLRFAGASTDAVWEGVNRLPTRINYYVGPRENWREDVGLYGKVRLAGAYPGIDVLFYDAQGLLKYDVIVSPGAEPQSVRMVFDGAERIDVTEQGELVLVTPAGEIRHKRPLVYQEGPAGREFISGHYVRSGSTVTIATGAYDASRALIIDPAIGYGSYLGGNGDDSIDYHGGIARDPEGNVYLTGRTNSVIGTLSGRTSVDSFVVKIDPSQPPTTQIVYKSYLGGSGWDEGFDIFVDATNQAYISGHTDSANFLPVLPNAARAFWLRLDSSGRYSNGTSIPGVSWAFGLAADGAGHVFVAGAGTAPVSPNPVFPPLGDGAGLLLRYDSSGSLSHAGLVGWFLRDLAIDGAGDVYVTGQDGWPLTRGFVAKVRNDFQSTVYLTHVTQALEGGDRGWGIAVDQDRNAYAVGEVYPPAPAWNALFAAKVDALGALSWQSAIGGTDGQAYALSVVPDEAGNLYIAGVSDASDFPFVAAFTANDGCCALAARLRTSTGAIAWSTPLRGQGFGGTTGYGVAASGTGTVYVSGDTNASTNLIGGRSGGFQLAKDAGSDLFVVAIEDEGTLYLLPSSTRWKPQRSEDPVTVEFMGPPNLQAATLTIRTAAGVAIDSNESTLEQLSPNKYRVKWIGPWVNSSGSWLARGDYTVQVQALLSTGAEIASASDDPYRQISLVEVMSVTLEGLQEDLSANPFMPKLLDQVPSQERDYTDQETAEIEPGLRIFADAPSPVSSIANRTVGVVATIDPAIPPDPRRPIELMTVKVYFKSFDVDDPAVSTASAPNVVDEDGDLEPSDVNDNHGFPREGTILYSGPDAWVVVPPGDVTASVQFRVSGYPGDNYRVAASASSSWLPDLVAHNGSHIGHLRHLDGSRLAAGEPESVSQMLTVWRTLHMEVDAMAPPPVSAQAAQRNFLTGHVLSIGVAAEPGLPRRIALLAAQTEPPIVLNDGSPDLSLGIPGGNGRFELGSLKIGKGQDALTFDSLKGNDFLSVRRDTGFEIPFELSNATQGAEPIVGNVLRWNGDFTVDQSIPADLYNGGTLTVGGVSWEVIEAGGETVTVADTPMMPFRLTDDDAEDPYAPTGGYLVDHSDDPTKNVLAQAYVHPVYDLSTMTKTASFRRNMPFSLLELGLQLDEGRDPSTVSSPRFWAAYVQGGFQNAEYVETGSTEGDGDPLIEFELVGAVGGLTVPPGLGIGVGSIVYLETAREYGPSLGPMCTDPTKLVPYLVAHELGHQLGMLGHLWGGIMVPGMPCSRLPFFSASSLRYIRWNPAE